MKMQIKKLIHCEKGSYYLISMGVLCVLMVIIVGAVSVGNAYRLKIRMQEAAEYVAQECAEQAVEITRYAKGSKQQTAVMDGIAREAVKEYFKDEKFAKKIEINHLIMKKDGRINVELSLAQRSLKLFDFGWGNKESQMEHRILKLKGTASIIINKD